MTMNYTNTLEHLTVYIKRMIIDSLKPRETTILDLSTSLCRGKGVNEVDITVTEVDVKTETVKLTLRGSNIDYDEVSKIMQENGAIIRSVDEANITSSHTE